MTERVLTPHQLYSLALDHYAAGRAERAASLLEALLTNAELGPDAQNLLGVIAAQRGDLESSARHLRALVAARPGNPDYHANLVTTLERLGDTPGAIAAAFEWASALCHSKRWPEAESVLRRVLQKEPGHRPARFNLATACEAQGKPEDSIAISLPLLRVYGPHDAISKNLIVRVEQVLSEALLDESLVGTVAHSAPSVAELAEYLPKVLCNLANSLARIGAYDASLMAYRRSQALAPAPLTEWNLALLLLLTGNFQEGWPAYEARWRWPDLSYPERDFAQPYWAGEPLAGKSILITAEQGFGDTLQFCRFVPRLLEQASAVTLEVQAELHALISHSLRETPVRVIPLQANPALLAEPVEFDVYCGLMSLPFCLGIDMARYRAPDHYLRPSAVALERWRPFMPRSHQMRIGIVWAGSAGHYKDGERSIHDPVELQALATLAGIEWHSLQLGSASAMRAQFLPDCLDHAAELDSFEATAGLLGHLDAVVTVDTMVAHLAGAMGLPVYLLLPFTPDWRWQLHRADTPWYPRTKLYRQQQRGVWQAPISDLVSYLQRLVSLRKFGSGTHVLHSLAT
jgi:tetratricopeptide (TPR) repeat protein